LFVGKRKKGVLSRQMQQWEDEMSARLSGQKIPPKYWEFPELEKGSIHQHCGYCVDINCLKTLNVESLFTESDFASSCGMTLCKWNCGAKYHTCKSSEHLIICPTYEEPDEFDWILRGVTDDFQNHSIGNFLIKTSRKKKAMEKQQVLAYKSKCIGDLWLGPEKLSNPSNLKRKQHVVPTPPKLVLKDNQNVTLNGMSLNIDIEKEARHQMKPKNMYTFVCGKSFRRDEYANHMKNVHDDIMGGLSNWIEQRCPLASYGCAFSSRLWYPISHGNLARREKSFSTSIVFSPVVESFGTSLIQQTPSMVALESNRNNPGIYSASSHSYKKSLADLPLEILYQILEHLDPLW
jgi:hypothetical protein